MKLFKSEIPENYPEIHADSESQEFLLNVAQQFIDVTPSNIDLVINQNLEKLVNFTNSDRGYIYLFSKNDSEMNLKYTYYKEGLKSKIENHQQINSEDFSELITPLKNKQPFVLKSKNDLSPSAYTIKSILDVEETKSVIAFPLQEKNLIFGFIGLDNVNEEKEWPENQKEFIRIFAEFISAALKRKKAVTHGLNIEQKLRTLFEKIEDTVFVFSPKGKILEINPAGLKLFGYDTLEEIMKLNVPNDLYVKADDWDKFQKIIAIQGFVKDHESQLKCKDGSKIHVIETTTTIKDNEGKTIAYEGILRDITRRKKLEQQLFQSQKMESIGMLAGGIAHDFNNILTVILGHSELLLLKMDENSPLYKDASGIHSGGKKAENLVKQLLGFSRKQPMIPEVINLNEVISELHKMIKRLVSEDIEVQIMLAQRLKYVSADPTQVQQILVNLVVNAGHAIKNQKNKNKTKQITIATDNVFIDKNFVAKNEGAKEGKHIMISVKDTGIGMDEKTKDQIFEPFFTTKEEESGTGLGLATVYGIVMQNKGYIHVESEPTAGTEFKIYWPVTESETVSDGKYNESQIRFTNESNRTILVVEDDPAVRELASSALKKIGYTVIEAENGRKALNLIREQKLISKIDMLFSDIVMPEMNGEELAQKVLEMNPDIKILLSSGYTRSRVFDKNASDDNYAFLFKPYTIKKLEKTIRLIFNETITSSP